METFDGDHCRIINDVWIQDEGSALKALTGSNGIASVIENSLLITSKT
jgi:hypothetical protein